LPGPGTPGLTGIYRKCDFSGNTQTVSNASIVQQIVRDRQGLTMRQYVVMKWRLARQSK
jgi:hypothetical protein